MKKISREHTIRLKMLESGHNYIDLPVHTVKEIISYWMRSVHVCYVFTRGLYMFLLNHIKGYYHSKAVTQVRKRLTLSITVNQSQFPCWYWTNKQYSCWYI